MTEFIARVGYDGKNYIGQDIHISAGTPVKEINGRLYHEGVPFCGQTSQVARDYFIWNGDGNWQYRRIYENAILFDTRIKVWDYDKPIYNEIGEIVGYEKAKRMGRFLPSECDYIRRHFPDLLEENAFIFNNFFFIGSDIKELESLYKYIYR